MSTESQEGDHPDAGDEPQRLDSFADLLRKKLGLTVDKGVCLDGALAETQGVTGAEVAGDDAESDAGSPDGRSPEGHPAQPLPTQNQYSIRGEVGRGGMGVVLKVWDEKIKRLLAMKVVGVHGTGQQERGRNDSQVLARFLEEAQITGQLDHPGIVPVHELGVDSDGRLFFTMRLVKGRDLATIFRHARDGREGWTQTRALGVLVKVCEAVGYAHSRGVIHRDLKPANVMVGRFGEAYVMDWGLARVEGHEDIHELQLQTGEGADGSIIATGRSEARDQEPDSSVVTLDGTVIGTPAYMPPEQAQGKIGELDARSDVYSMGAMLYELLTGHGPYVECESPLAILAASRQGPPEPVDRMNPGHPPELVAICEKAMARRQEERYPGALEMAEDLQAYLDNRVVQAYRTGAWAELKKWVGRNRGTATAVAVAVVVAVVGLVALISLEKKAKHDILLATDPAVRLKLEEEAESDLWPAYPHRVPAMESWLAKATGLGERLGEHRKKLERLQRLESPTDELRTQEGLVGALETWGETIAAVRERLSFARSVERTTVEEPRDDWEAAIASIADPAQCPAYDGLAIQPQLGLIPVGKDPHSRLWEFALVQTGKIPVRDEEGSLGIEDNTALVFVLLPGGTFAMGAVKPEGEGDSGPNLDPQARPNESPVHDVTLEPFFLSKYEMTQGQWERFTGENPSYYKPPKKVGEFAPTPRHPVEQVSWVRCDQILSRLGLILPTEAQWEYAARAGTTTVWFTGDDRDSLREPEMAANFADRAADRAGLTWPAIQDWPELDDGFPVSSPVGTHRPNVFGLHDIAGNVWEWCRDGFASYSERPPAGGEGVRFVEGAGTRVTRGGSFFNTSGNARSAYRDYRVPGLQDVTVGVRPARILER